jgi:hypothetical protein
MDHVEQQQQVFRNYVLNKHNTLINKQKKNKIPPADLILVKFHSSRSKPSKTTTLKPS